MEERLRILRWRDEQLELVTLQLTNNFPELQSVVTDYVASAGHMKCLKISSKMEHQLADLRNNWIQEQKEIAVKRSGASLDDILSKMGPGLAIERDTRNDVAAGASAALGMTSVIGSIVAVPSIVAMATVTTGGVLGVFATSSISLPILGLGAVGLGLATFTGSNVVEKAYGKVKDGLQSRLINSLEREVFGYGDHLDQRSVLNDIQGAVMEAAKVKLRALT